MSALNRRQLLTAAGVSALAVPAAAATANAAGTPAATNYPALKVTTGA